MTHHLPEKPNPDAQLIRCLATKRGERIKAKFHRRRVPKDRLPLWWSLILQSPALGTMSTGLVSSSIDASVLIWESYSAPLRKAREERAVLISHLVSLLNGECDTHGRWCLTHHTNECHQSEVVRWLKDKKIW